MIKCITTSNLLNKISNGIRLTSSSLKVSDSLNPSINASNFGQISSLASCRTSDRQIATSIARTSFVTNSKSKIVEIPYGVNRLKYKCFYNNPFIEKIIIPSSVRYIDYLSFEKLPNLKEIYISKRVKYISDYAFGGCNYPLIKCEIDKKPDTWSKKWNYSYYALNIFKRKMKVLWSKTKK